MRARGLLCSIAAVAVLFIAGCASSTQSSAAAPPVKVLITAEPAVQHYVKTEKLAEATEDALRKYASGAGPATVTINFESVVAVPDTNIDTWTPGESYGVPRTVAIISTTPWNEGAQPTTSSTRPYSAPVLNGNGSRPAVKGTYTVADANGNVLERKSLYLSVDYGDGYSGRLDALRSTGTYLAKRVARLTRKQG